MLGLPVFVKEGFPFPQDFSLKTSVDSYLYFCDCLYLFSVLDTFLSSVMITFLPLSMVFDTISPNIDEVLLINPSTVLVFGNISIHHKDGLTYSGGILVPKGS